MTPATRSTEDLLRGITATGEDAPSLLQREHDLKLLREQTPEAVRVLEHQLLLILDRMNRGLLEARRNLEALNETNERLTRPPWLLGVFRFLLDDTDQAVVSFNGSPRVVTLAEGLAANQFERGDDVFLNSDLNLLVGRSPWGSVRVGETAEFVRHIDLDRIALRWRDEEVIVECTESLAQEELTEGDLIRWCKGEFLAIEKIERSASRRYFLDDVPDATAAHVGGQRAALNALTATLTSILADPVMAEDYQLSGRQSVLLVGPPGCGKTLMARVAASETMRISGKKCHFAVVKPAEWENPYVGGTQANIRSCFESLREAADRGDHVVVFMDEIECSGRIRGNMMGHHSDKFVAAFLAELDGFTARGGVAIVSATNRKDLIDPALLERLSDVEIQVPRPNIEAAEEIFQVHLPENLPFSPNGSASAETRAQLIDLAVARIFDPNGDNALSVIKFRDARERTVAASELMSGRLIEQICRATRQRAFMREVTEGDRGIRVVDIEEAVADAIDRLATTLSVQNVRSYLPNLPQDMDIMSVEPVIRQGSRAHRFRNN